MALLSYGRYEYGCVRYLVVGTVLRGRNNIRLWPLLGWIYRPLFCFGVISYFFGCLRCRRLSRLRRWIHTFTHGNWVECGDWDALTSRSTTAPQFLMGSLSTRDKHGIFYCHIVRIAVAIQQSRARMEITLVAENLHNQLRKPLSLSDFPPS